MPTTDHRPPGRTAAPQGCLATGMGAILLALLAPFVLISRSWRRWRRGPKIRSTLEIGPVDGPGVGFRSRIDLTLDVPPPAEPGFTRRLTDTVVRVAESLRGTDDVYHLIYRLPWDDEPVALPVGPLLQELGERFSLVQSQGVLDGRTAVWLALARDRALAEIIDPTAYDPEAPGEPDALLTDRRVRWSMASEWARVGPSLVVRLVVIVPTEAASRVSDLFDTLARTPAGG